MWSEIVSEDDCVYSVDEDECREHVDYCPDDEDEQKHDSSENTYEYNGADVIVVHCIIQLCAVMSICTAFRKEVHELYLSVAHIVLYLFSSMYILSITHAKNKINAELSNIGGGLAIIVMTFTAKFMRENDDPVSVYIKLSNNALYLALGIFMCSMWKHAMRLFVAVASVSLFILHFYDDTVLIETFALRVCSIFAMTFVDNTLECMCFRQFLFVLLTEAMFMMAVDVDVTSESDATMQSYHEHQVYLPGEG